MAALQAHVSDFILSARPDAIPEAARDAVAWLLLDTLGIAIGGAQLDAGRIARDAAVILFSNGAGAPGARILFDGRRVSPAGAVFAGASQIDNLDGHDGYNPTKGHIGVVVLPALAALAEEGGPLDGREALDLAVIGYEIAGRAAISLHATVSDYHTSGAWNALGVAAMAARRRGLSRDQLRQALGIAEYHGPRSQMMREIANPTMLHDGSGWGALAGMSAATLAELGFQGAPAITVEDASVARHWADLGTFWQVEHQYIKPYPICRWAHAAIDAARGLLAANAFAPQDIAEIEISTFHEAACLYDGMPETTSKAQYSLAFAVAVMLAHGRIGVEHITGAGLSDGVVAAIHKRISVRESTRHSERFPTGRWADVKIILRDGRALHSGDVHATGGPEAPWTRSQIREKFRQFAVPVIGQDRARRLEEAILGLRTGAGWADVAEHLYDQP